MVESNQHSQGAKSPSVDLEKDPAIHSELAGLEHIDDPQSMTTHAEVPAEARKIIRKIDYRLLPLMIFLYTLTFLDRVNIGNARLWHLERDLGMTGYQYNIAVLVFFIPVIIFEIPSNMMLSRVKPRYWVSGLVLGFGMSVTFAGFCSNFAGLVVSRLFTGAFEAGMLPACLYLLSSWYRRHELLTRVALLMVANDIAGTISGLLGAGLGSLDGTGGYSGWSWIFFIEGGFTCFAAILAFLFLPPFPEESKFLTQHEKEWLLRRLRQDTVGGPLDKTMGLKSSLRALGDWKVLITGMLYLSVCVTAYSISVFQPTILATFAWNGIKANLLTAPVRVAAGIFSVAVGIWSDKSKRRGTFCIAGYSVSIVGSFLVMLVTKYQVRYLGLYMSAIGIYICQPLVLAWGANQVVGKVKRGVLTSFAVATGQFGGIITSLVFPKKDGPMYVPGLSTCIAFAFCGILSAGFLWGYGVWENGQREAGKRDYLRTLPQEEQDLLGEKHPDFRFTP